MRTIITTCLILLTFMLHAADEPRPAAEVPRPTAWAVPVTLDGVHNLYRVTSTLYRCAQPDAAGMKQLETLGIKTVINLRQFHSDSTEVEGTRLLNEELSVKTWHIEDEDVIRVLRILGKPENGPFLIHCKHGSDRTGLMCAMYRIVVQGWTKEAAIDELKNGGYGYWAGWTNIISYLKEVDIERMKKAVAAP